MSSNLKRILGALAFFLWTVFVVAAFYVVQKPNLFTIIPGLAATLWTLIVWVGLVVNALGMGHWLIQRLPRLEIDPIERLLLSGGIGLGLQGLAGFMIGLTGWTHPAIWVGLQVILLLLLGWRKVLSAVYDDLQVWRGQWRTEMAASPAWIRIALGSTLLLAFLLALAPPAEAFDALFYHLVGPQRILDGLGLQPSNMPHFWFPALPESVFLWAQGMGSPRATQLLHLTWAGLCALLLWQWALRVWGRKAAQSSLVILISMPSLYLLASWAYTDFALSFYALATLYGVYKAHENNTEDAQLGWIILAGIAAGMAMGVKYTSFLIPVTGVLLLVWWQRQRLPTALKAGFIFGVVALAVAAPWYLRNWMVMHNPVYPFVFGGLQWDAFRADWYSGAGTGIGADLKELLLLPLNATLGHRDANYFDGRIGPLYLVLAPLTLFVLAASRRSAPQQRKSLFAIALFTLLSVAAWVVGVVNSSALWQTRLLFPALIPFALPTALGWLAVKKLDTSQLRVSFIFNFVVIAIVALTIIDAGLGVILRNPLAHAVGIESQEAYLHKVQPTYAQALQLLKQTPEDAQIYFLFEPRSYYASRSVTPDPILDNLGHDLFIAGSPEGVLASWQAEGYTYILVNQRGMDFLAENHSSAFSVEYQIALDTLIQNYFELAGSTEDGAYVLYRIAPNP